MWRYITYNVAAVSESPRQDALKIKPLTEAQARRLIDAMKGHRLEALYRIALSLELRRGEILGLLWDDVDLDKKVLRLTGQVQTVDNVTRRISSTKTEAGARELPLPEVLINVLRRHWKLQQDERSRIDDVEWHDDGLVFPSNRGTPMWPRNLIRQFKGVLRTAGLPERTRFHDLRHSAATIMLAQEVPLKTVSDILGHTDIRTTANIYGHTDDDQKRSATEKIADLFGSDDDIEESRT